MSSCPPYEERIEPRRTRRAEREKEGGRKREREDENQHGGTADGEGHGGQREGEPGRRPIFLSAAPTTDPATTTQAHLVSCCPPSHPSPSHIFSSALRVLRGSILLIFWFGGGDALDAAARL